MKKPKQPQDSLLKDIGMRIKRNRKAKHLTQSDVGEALGSDRATISRYENGKIDIPVSALMRIGEICGFEPRTFLRSESDALSGLQGMLERYAKLGDMVKEKSMDYLAHPDAREAPEPEPEAEQPVKLSEKSMGMIEAYGILVESKTVSPEALDEIGEDIIKYIEGELGSPRNRLYERLLKYTEALNMATLEINTSKGNMGER
ncbi:MAG: helix-turn-helix domain-containing protein [Lachnospiraceae bacterium]|nr:helix-turn-helix domain-containing protein [Lachnospiraceae bacterium]